MDIPMPTDIPTTKRATLRRTITDIRLSTAAVSTSVEAGAAITTIIMAATGMVGATGTEAAITVAVDGTAAASGRGAADTQAVAATAVDAAKKKIRG
jgi:hypothetical protein